MQQTVHSITKGVEILKCLSHEVDTVSRLSDKLAMSKGTVHRLLKTLEVSSLVRQDPITRRYCLGPLILELASRPTISHQNLVICALNEMKHLRDVSGETVVLHIRIGLERICLEELQSPERIKYTAGKGYTAPIHTGSAGKVLLSELNDSERQLLLEHLKLSPVGPNTITKREALLTEVEKAKRQGYATSFSERIPGSASISVPIANYICPVAMSVLGPDNRFTLEKMTKLSEVMKKCATLISARLRSGGAM